MIKYALIIFLFLCFGACNSTGKKTAVQQPVAEFAATSPVPEAIGTPDTQTDSCSYYVYAIVYTSDLKKKNRDYATVLKDTAKPISYFVDHSDDTSIVIHVGYDNEAEPGEKVEATLAWINVDLKNNEVKDISIDPDNGILLKVDKKILKAMKQCRYKIP